MKDDALVTVQVPIPVMVPTSRSRLLGLVDADELLAHAARGVDQLVQPAERDRVLQLVLRLLPRLAENNDSLIRALLRGGK